MFERASTCDLYTLLIPYCALYENLMSLGSVSATGRFWQIWGIFTLGRTAIASGHDSA